MQSGQRDCALEGSGLLIKEVAFVSNIRSLSFSFLRMCGTSSNSRGFSRCTPLASKLDWETDASRLYVYAMAVEQ